MPPPAKPMGPETISALVPRSPRSGRPAGAPQDEGRLLSTSLLRLFRADQPLQNLLVAHRPDVDRQRDGVERSVRGVDDPLLCLDHRRVLLLEGVPAGLR